MNILIQGGRVIDPETQLDTLADIAISNGHILAIGSPRVAAWYCPGWLIWPRVWARPSMPPWPRALKTNCVPLPLPALPAWYARPIRSLCLTSPAWLKC